MAVERFFQRFAQLSIQPSGRIFDELDRVAESENWSKKVVRKKRCALAIATWEDRYGGTGGELERLQMVCRDLEISPIPNSKTKCVKAIKSKRVNIYDFLNGNFMSFGSWKALSEYSRENDKVFPLKKAKNDPVLKAMLIVFV